MPMAIAGTTAIMLLNASAVIWNPIFWSENVFIMRTTILRSFTPLAVHLEKSFSFSSHKSCIRKRTIRVIQMDTHRTITSILCTNFLNIYRDMEKYRKI